MTRQFEEQVSERFGVPAPTLQASTGRASMRFSRLSCGEFGHGWSRAAEPEDAYSLHLHLRATDSYDLQLKGRSVAGDAPAREGAIFLSSLENEPAVGLRAPFDIARIYIPQAAIEDIAVGGGAAKGLRLPEQGLTDPLLLELARTLLPLFGPTGAQAQLFLDSVALVLLEHILTTYGGQPMIVRQSKGGLAPWQERRAKEFIRANLAGHLAMTDVAKQCELSPSHFAQAFRTTTGRPPHRWLLEQRVEFAKRSLEDPSVSLETIAERCGFSGASHLSRIFTRFAGMPPSAWRRGHRG